jgi:hypothetical protein
MEGVSTVPYKEHLLTLLRHVTHAKRKSTEYILNFARLIDKRIFINSKPNKSIERTI